MTRTRPRPRPWSKNKREQFRPGRAQRTRCDYGRSSSRKGHTRQHILEWKREMESTVTTEKKRKIELGFSQHVNAVFQQNNI